MQDLKKEIFDNRYRSDAIGGKQWQILNSIVDKYSKIDISDFTHNDFSDDEWIFITTGDGVGINFCKTLNKEADYPLEVCLKVLTIILLKDLGYSVGSIQAIRGFINNFVPEIKSSNKPVLKAKRDCPWLLFGEIEAFEISFILESLALRKDIKQSIAVLSWMDRYQTFSDLAPFLEGYTSPWVEDGISSTSWLKSMRQQVGQDHERVPYSAIPDEVVSDLVKRAMPYIDDISDSKDIDDFYSVDGNSFVDILMYVRSSYESSHLTSANWTVEITRDKKFSALIASHYEILEGISLLPSDHTRESKLNYMNETIQNKWFSLLFENSKLAAIWIVALTTGLRNIDIRNLQDDCLKYSDKFDLWFLKANIQKTKNTIHIPVGNPTVKAVKLLRWLKGDLKCSWLITKAMLFTDVNVDNHDDFRLGSGGALNRRLKAFSDYYGIKLETMISEEDEATCHCIRATLASYIGRHSTLAILILRKLFGHTNNIMPDQYIRHNIFVREKRAALISEMHSDTAQKIAKSIVVGQVAGVKGDELAKGAEFLKDKIKLENNALTEMDIHTKLEEVLTEIIFNDIRNEQTQTLLTPMGVICMRATNHSVDSPCAAKKNKKERDIAGVSRALFNALPQLPNPGQCIGIDCPDALMTKEHSLPLLNQFDWYTNVLRKNTDSNSNIDEDAKNFVETYYPIVMSNNILTEAKDFIDKYGSDLKKLYSIDRPEGYFND